jgi:hypothetical protein
MPCPFTMSSLTVSRALAEPLPWSSTSMPSIREAASEAIIVSTGPDWSTGWDMGLPG